MEAPHREVLEVFLKYGVRPVETRQVEEGVKQTLWVLDSKHLPPMVLVLEGNGDDPGVIEEEIKQFRDLDSLSPEINIPLGSTEYGPTYEILFRLDAERTVMVHRKMVGYLLTDPMWMKLAHHWLAHSWFVAAYVEAKKKKKKT